MNKKQTHFLENAFKTVTKIQATDEVIVILPAGGEVPESKFELDIIYLIRAQKERVNKGEE